MSATEISTPVGSNLRRARRGAGLTQKQLAESLDVEPITVSRWERGVTHPSIPVLRRIGGITDTATADLVRDETGPGVLHVLAELRREIAGVRALVEAALPANGGPHA